MVRLQPRSNFEYTIADLCFLGFYRQNKGHGRFDIKLCNSFYALMKLSEVKKELTDGQMYFSSLVLYSKQRKRASRKIGYFSCFQFTSGANLLIDNHRCLLVNISKDHMFKYIIFHIYTSILHHLQVYYELTKWPTPRWLDSSVGTILHRYRRGHVF